MDQWEELSRKEGLVFNLMGRSGWKGLLIARQNLFSWLTGGLENRVVNQSQFGNSYLLYTNKGRKYVIGTSGETGLVFNELLKQAGYELYEFGWDDEGGVERAIYRLMGSFDDVASDGCVALPDVYGFLRELTRSLLPVEAERYRVLGKDIGTILSNFSNDVEPGMTELEAQGILAASLARREIHPVVLMVGGDENAAAKRHFLAGNRKITRRLTVIGCLRRHGLILSATRDIFFEPPTGYEADRHRVVADISARLVAASAAGVPHRFLYELGASLYQQAGLTGEFHQHPIGGPTGYEIRYEMVAPGSTGVLQTGQAVAWNPTVPGHKSEDTWLIGEKGPELLCTDNWPQLEFPHEGMRITRPGLLVR